MEFDGLAQALKDLIFFHYFFIAILPLIYFFNFLIVLDKNYAMINKRLWKSMIAIYFLLAVNFLSGISILAMQQFILSFKIFAMFLVFCLCLGFEIYRNKTLKTARIAQSSMENYLKICRFFYPLLLCLILVLLFGAKFL